MSTANGRRLRGMVTPCGLRQVGVIKTENGKTWVLAFPLSLFTFHLPPSTFLCLPLRFHRTCHIDRMGDISLWFCEIHWQCLFLASHAVQTTSAQRVTKCYKHCRTSFTAYRDDSIAVCFRPCYCCQTPPSLRFACATSSMNRGGLEFLYFTWNLKSKVEYECLVLLFVKEEGLCKRVKTKFTWVFTTSAAKARWKQLDCNLLQDWGVRIVRTGIAPLVLPVFSFDFSVLTFSRSAPSFSSYLSYRPHGRYLVVVLRDPLTMLVSVTADLQSAGYKCKHLHMR